MVELTGGNVGAEEAGAEDLGEVVKDEHGEARSWGRLRKEKARQFPGAEVTNGDN